MYLTVTLFATGGAFAQATPKHINDLKKAIESSRSISMNFYTSTDSLDRNNKPSEHDMTATLFIKCGFSCSHVMQRITNSFAHSTIMPSCPKDSAYLVIKFNNSETLSYFHGGEISKYGNHCYYNKESINDVVHVLDFF